MSDFWRSHHFNHTFATYRGISGQLYSGYQLENLDENKLVSLEDIFGSQGYSTTFINSEPNNVRFTNYLETMGFEDVISEPGNQYKGEANSVSDREMYEMLLDTMEEKAQEDRPFFIAMYTFGTHLSFDSTDETFGDGENVLLNKFYNVDYQFGKFMEKFEQSDMAENTILVFTADHATYIDSTFQSAFPDLCGRPGDCSRVPLFFYYRGIEPQEIDAEGRNSIDLAPSLCDYIGVDGVNYFLGESLFAPAQNNNSFETFFTNSNSKYTTEGGTAQPLSESEEKIFDSSVEDYYALKSTGAGA